MNKVIIALFALTFVAGTYATVQTGKFTRTYWSTGHVFEKDSSKERTDNFIAKFRKPFAEVPNMEVGLYGFDLGFNNAGIFVDVVRVAKDGFDVKITCPSGSLCYYVAVDFIAYTDDESFDHDSIHEQDFNSAQLTTWRTGGGERYVSQNVPTVLSGNVGAISFISGFQFGAGANIRLRSWISSVSGEGATVSFGTWADTKLKDFRIGVLFFEVTDDTASFDVASDTTGAMYNGSGGRNDNKRKEHIPVEGAQFFVAFNHIDLINGRNYRVSHSHFHGDDYLRTQYGTWADTAVWLVKDSVLYTPIN